MNQHVNLYSLESYLINKTKKELLNGEEKDPITKLRLLCLSRGATGILHIGRAFRDKDDDGSKVLNEEEFTEGIKKCGLDVTEDEIKQMFQSFDEHNSGSIHMTEFLRKLRPPMHQGRINSVYQAFDKMDKDDDGVINLADIKRVYSVQEHPKYQSGEMSEDEILTKFLHNFDGDGGDSVGQITREEFLNYYASISAGIDDDTFFDLMMRQAYHL